MPDTTEKQYAARELMKLIGDNDTIDKINVWLARGDGVAVYENQALDSSGMGDTKFISYGGPDAQLAFDPPVQLPDFPQEINWMFRLVGTYRGEQIRHLPTPDEEEWHTPYDVASRIIESFTGKKYDSLRPGPFTERLSSYGFEVRQLVDADGNTASKRFEVTIVLVNPIVEIRVRSWLYDEGINVVAPFDWTIDDAAHGTRTGGDPNLGGTIVSVYNNSLPPKENK